MYNSSIKGQGRTLKFRQKIEIPHKVFFNDLSKIYMREEFKSADCVYSDIAWKYGYKIFNDNAKNSPNSYFEYCTNANKLVELLRVPSFLVAGKAHRKFFPKAIPCEIELNNSGISMPDCRIFVWNYDYDYRIKTTKELIEILSKRFHNPLDFSCGTGEHLMKFDDFIACDIDRDCLTYLSILVQERSKNIGTTKT